MQVKWVDPDTKEEVDTGLVRVKAQNQTAGGGAVDVGGGNEFGGAGEDEGADDHEETKLDQFWVGGPFLSCICCRAITPRHNLAILAELPIH